MSTREDVAARIRKPLRETLMPSDAPKADAANDDTRLVEDLEFDSLDTVEFAMACEDEFDLEVSDEEMENVQTIGQAVDLIVSKLTVTA